MPPPRTGFLDRLTFRSRRLSTLTVADMKLSIWLKGWQACGRKRPALLEECLFWFVVGGKKFPSGDRITRRHKLYFTNCPTCKFLFSWPDSGSEDLRERIGWRRSSLYSPLKGRFPRSYESALVPVPFGSNLRSVIEPPDAMNNFGLGFELARLRSNNMRLQFRTVQSWQAKVRRNGTSGSCIAQVWSPPVPRTPLG